MARPRTALVVVLYDMLLLRGTHSTRTGILVWYGYDTGIILLKYLVHMLLFCLVQTIDGVDVARV